MVQNPTDDNNDRSDDLAPLSRQKRYSKNSKLERCTDPTQLGFYPPKWMDFLEECKVETHTYAMVHEPWLHSKLAIDGFISNAVTMTIQKWRHTQKTVVKGYYPKYKKEMCKLVRAPTQSTLLRWPSQLFEDLALWCGELKNAAASSVHTHYDIFPPMGTHLSKTETCQYVKHRAEALIKKSAFAHGGKDDEVWVCLPCLSFVADSLQGHMNNFGHPAIHELIHVFIFGHDHRIGNLRLGEFGTRIPNNTLTLIVTVVSPASLVSPL